MNNMENEEKLIWITKVEKLTSKYKVYYTDCEEPLTLTEDQLIEFRMMKGNSFYKEEFESIINSLDFGKVLDQMLHYIDYKPRTEKEVREKLEEKLVLPEIADQVIEKLINLSFIDDERYTKMYIDEQFRYLMGPKAISYNLTLKGIEKSLIDKYICELNEDDIYNHAVEIANKTLKTVEGYPVSKQKESVYNRLFRMGYPSGIVNKTMNVLEYSSLDNNRFEKDYLLITKKETDKNKIVQKLMAKGYNYSDIKNKMSK